MSAPAQYVSFLLAGEEYAVRILRVREIVEYEALTRVPMAPASVRGVLNLRGRVVPVIDLGHKLGLPPIEPTRWTCILMVKASLDGEQVLMGLMVDAVGEVLQFEPADIEPPPPFGAKVRLDYMDGIGKIAKRIVLLLDIDRVLSPEELLSASLPPEGEPPAASEPPEPSPEPPPSGEPPAASEPPEAPPSSAPEMKTSLLEETGQT